MSGVCACSTLVMGFAEQGLRCGGVGRCIRGYLSVIHAGCCEGRGDSARNPADCGVSLYRVVVTLRPRRWGSACFGFSPTYIRESWIWGSEAFYLDWPSYHLLFRILSGCFRAESLLGLAFRVYELGPEPHLSPVP